jgi:hypothetical protein
MRRTTPLPQPRGRYHPGTQDGTASLNIFENNKKALDDIIDGPHASLLNLVGAYLPKQVSAHDARFTMRNVVLREVLQETFQCCSSDQLSDVTARFALELFSRLNSPLPRKGRGGSSSVVDRSKQHLQLIVALFLLRNMPGGLDGAHTSLCAQMARCRCAALAPDTRYSPPWSLCACVGSCR